MLAQVLKPEIDFVAHLVTHDPADADPARLGQGFQPRRDIDAIAEDVVVVDDDVAEIDADAKLDAALARDTVIAQRHLALQFDRAAHRIDDAREFDQQPVAGRLDNAAAMLGNFGVHQFAPGYLERRERALLVLAHQPRIAGDIGRQHRRQAPLDPLPPGIHGGNASAISPFTIAARLRSYCLRCRNAIQVTRYDPMENNMAEPAERMKMMRARRRRQGLRELRLVVPDARSAAVRNRIAAQAARLNLDSEREALLWIEAVSEFDAPAPR
jgi:hypothetical protein